eukprot:812173-Pleurochrysis_carterae.AAC.1
MKKKSNYVALLAVRGLGLVTPQAPRKEERCSAVCHRTGLGTTRPMIYRCLALVGCIAQVAAFGSVPGGGGDNDGSPSPPGAGTLVECEFNLAGEDHWEEKRAFRY